MSRSPRCRTAAAGPVFVFDLDSQGVAAAAAIPRFVDQDFTVCWAVGRPGHQILEHLVELSGFIQNDLEAEFAATSGSQCRAGVRGTLLSYPPRPLEDRGKHAFQRAMEGCAVGFSLALPKVPADARPPQNHVFVVKYHHLSTLELNNHSGSG